MADIDDLIQRARTIRIETKSKKNTADRIGGLLLDIVRGLGEAQVLKKAQYGGIVATSADVVSDYAAKGYSGPYFYLVGSSLSSLVVYQYAGTGSPVQAFGGAAYNFADYSEALRRIDDLGPDMYGLRGIALTIESGSITTGTNPGVDADNNKRLRTNGYVNASTIKVEIANGKYVIFGYDDDGFVTSEAPTWRTATAVISLSNCTKYRIVFSFDEDAVMQVSDFASLGVKVYGVEMDKKKVVLISDIVNDAVTGGANVPASAEVARGLNDKIGSDSESIALSRLSIQGYVKSDGTFSYTTGYSRSDYIPLPAGRTVTIHAGTPSLSVYPLAVYALDGTLIEAWRPAETGYGKAETHSYTANANVKFIVCTDNRTTYTNVFSLKLSGYGLKKEIELSKQSNVFGWMMAETFSITSVTRNSDGDVTALSVTWPDSSTGIISVTRDSNGDVTAMAGAYGTSTYTINITRDSDGNVLTTSLTKS